MSHEVIVFVENYGINRVIHQNEIGRRNRINENDDKILPR